MTQSASASRTTTSPSPGQTTGPGQTSGALPGPGEGQPDVPTVAGRLDDLKVSIRRSLSGTPGELRVLALLAVAVSLIFATGAFTAFGSANDALRRGEANVLQLVRIQAIHTNLVRADADATNSFLVGGLEPSAQRASYTEAIEQASRLIAEAARAQPADGAALGALNSFVTTYSGLIEQARASNRQALPVGAQYLRVASSGLRTDALPILDVLVKANDARVDAEFDAASGARTALVVSGLLALLVLGAGMVWLSRRTHRYINPPLAAATAGVLVTLVVGFVVLSGVSARVDAVRTGSYASTLATARARIAAFDAKSNESLTLIARGSGSAAFEQAWAGSSKVVTTQGDAAAQQDSDAAGLSALWKKYADTHAQIRAADGAGRWEAAVTQAIGTGPASANAAFDAFDKGSGGALTSSSSEATESLNAPRSWLPFAAWLGLLVGLAAAVSAWWGVSLRLEEYR